jgi:hypothetical protein
MDGDGYAQPPPPPVPPSAAMPPAGYPALPLPRLGDGIPAAAPVIYAEDVMVKLSRGRSHLPYVSDTIEVYSLTYISLDSFSSHALSLSLARARARSLAPASVEPNRGWVPITEAY